MSHTPSSSTGNERIELECKIITLDDKPSAASEFPDTPALVEAGVKQHDESQAPAKHGLVGYVCIVVSLVSYIGLSELEPILFPAQYRKPYLLNYLSQIAMILMIIPWSIMKLRESASLCCTSHKPLKPVMSATSSASATTKLNINISTISSYQSIESIDVAQSINSAYKHGRCLSAKCRQLLMPSISVAFLIFGSNYLWFISLYYTIASVNNTLYQSQCAFVLIFSVLFLKQRLNKFSILSVVLSIAGVVIISLLGDEAESDSNVDPNTFGIVMCILAAMLYALAQVRMSQIESELFDAQHTMRDTLLFQFLMGVDVLVLGIPGFFALDILGVETLQTPDLAECGALFVATMLSFTFMAALLFGIAQRGALFMSMGILLVIPATFGVDMAFYGLVLTPWTIVGSLCILVGFVVMHLRGIPSDEEEKSLKGHDQPH